MATLGRPNWATPNRLDAQALRAWQQVSDIIRQRLLAVEAQAGTNAATLTRSSELATAARQALQQQIDEILLLIQQLRNDIPSAEDEAGLTVTMTCAEAIDIGAPVWVSAPQTVSLLDPDDALARNAYLGIAAEGGAVGAAISVALPGATVTMSAASFTPGAALYAELGGVTHTPSGDALPVGVACDTQTIGVGPGTIALANPQGATGEGHLPVTYSLAAAAIALAELFDLGTPGPQDGDTWVYDAGLGKFRPAPADSSGGILPVVTGEVPPVLVYLDDGSLVYTEIE